MTDQPSQPSDPTAPPEVHAAPPPPPAAPVPAAPPPAASYGSAPQQNPYGGYTAAPVASYTPGEAPVGSLPYVEAHFGPVATFGPRVLAYLIDGLVSAIGVIPLIIGTILVATGAASATTINPETGALEPSGMGGGGLVGLGIALIVVGGIISLAIWLWNRVFRMGRTGQSIGKKMMGLKLVNAATGQPIGAGMSFLREIVHSIVNQIVYLSFLWMLWDANRQTLADLVVKSSVITVPKQ